MNQITDINLLPSRCKEIKKLLSPEIEQSAIIDEIILEIYNGWPGATGNDRVVRCIKLISERISEYAAITGKTEVEFLTLFAKARRVNYVNWFNDKNLPSLSKVYVFDTEKDFKNKFPSGKFICPACNQVTTDYSECNSGATTNGENKCNWKVYGLFGDMGKGISVLIKDRIETGFPKPTVIFKPIELP